MANLDLIKTAHEARKRQARAEFEAAERGREERDRRREAQAIRFLTRVLAPHAPSEFGDVDVDHELGIDDHEVRTTLVRLAGLEFVYRGDDAYLEALHLRRPCPCGSGLTTLVGPGIRDLADLSVAFVTEPTRGCDACAEHEAALEELAHPRTIAFAADSAVGRLVAAVIDLVDERAEMREPVA